MPIPIHPSASTREQYVRNLVEVWLSATPEQEAAGRRWYTVAHQIAEMIGDGNAVLGAGLLAALSPQTSWELNIELAADAVDDGYPSRHFGDAIRKARKIMQGVDPRDVLPMRRKTGHFYRCILDPSDPDAVVIDRHAHDAMVGKRFGSAARGLDAYGRYDMVADVYREAAHRLGELPQVVQAVVWTVWREEGKS